MVEKIIGEIVIRTPNKEKMVAFYQDVIELETLNVMGNMHFFKVSEGFGGLAQSLALFELDVVSDVDDTAFDSHDTRKTPFHHFAFMIDLKDYYNEFSRISALGYKLRTMEHAVAQARSFYLYDPDGNTVEFVCHDPSIAEIR